MPYRLPTSTNDNHVVPDLLISSSRTREIKADLAPNRPILLPSTLSFDPHAKLGLFIMVLSSKANVDPVSGAMSTIFLGCAVNSGFVDNIKGLNQAGS
jgi:hypothetical protein